MRLLPQIHPLKHISVFAAKFGHLQPNFLKIKQIYVRKESEFVTLVFDGIIKIIKNGKCKAVNGQYFLFILTAWPLDGSYNLGWPESFFFLNITNIFGRCKEWYFILKAMRSKTQPADTSHLETELNYKQWHWMSTTEKLPDKLSTTINLKWKWTMNKKC